LDDFREFAYFENNLEGGAFFGFKDNRELGHTIENDEGVLDVSLSKRNDYSTRVESLDRNRQSFLTQLSDLLVNPRIKIL
jgi:hypothetical protein